MIAFIIKRIVSGLLLLWAATTLVFLFLHLDPRSLAQQVLGTNATAEQIDAKMIQLGLDRPLIVQYGDWVGPLLHGSLGTSYSGHQEVAAALSTRTTVTLSLVIAAVIVTAAAGVLLGMLAARWRGWVDQLVQGATVLGTALPGFWLALVLVTVFAVRLRWFPATGFTRFDADPGAWLRGLVLPVLALSVAGISGVAMQVRSAVIEVGQRDFVRTLESHGLSRARILYRHVLRNAASPALVILSLQFVGMLSGAVVVEQIFALPGLGSLAVSATSSGDVPIVMGIVTVTVTMVVIVNLLVDLAAAWLNPKVRLR